MIRQNTNVILMIRPVNFQFNKDTAKDNFYQKNEGDFSKKSANELAQEEFDQFVIKLRNKGIEVIVENDLLEPFTPDSIFPNNWVSFHQNGKVGLYPMLAENRRLERRVDILEGLRSKGFEINEIVDFTEAEEEGRYLEGTGSIVLDRVNNKAFAALSKRTDKTELDRFCETFSCTAVPFTANQTVNGERLPIYHTNVMMHVGDEYTVLCADAIDDENEKKLVIDNLTSDGKEIILITEKQKENFAGNMLQLKNNVGDKFTVMSSAAYKSLTEEQITKLLKYGEIIHSPLSTIEKLGGGSARCMMAEIFLPKKKR